MVALCMPIRTRLHSFHHFLSRSAGRAFVSNSAAMAMGTPTSSGRTRNIGRLSNYLLKPYCFLDISILWVAPT